MAAPGGSTGDTLPPRIVLYDGVCGLCNRTVSWLLARDRARDGSRDRMLWFAPLQGETAALLRARHAEIPTTLESVVYVEQGRVYLRSKAFLQAARYLNRPWRWAHAFRWLPAAPLDLLYRLIARIRYRVWGQYDACRLPATDEKERLLP